MIVAILEVLDSTIVNISLPHMMGALGANSEQITWVLTAYIVASGIFIPLTGFLSQQLGRKNLLLISITGFLISSMLCGLATSLSMMIFFRILQGSFGASLIPLSQAILRDVFPIEEHGKAMAIWGIGIMAAPVLGPTIGGYIVEYSNWRWIFYLNVPFCLISLLLTCWVIKDNHRHPAKIDWTGLLLMATGIGTLQVFLDQGNNKGWFSSHFIILLCAVSAYTLATFIIRGLNKPDNVVKLSLFKDRHFSTATCLLGLYAGCLFSAMAVQPIQLEQLMGYPAVTAGLVMMPRGIMSAIGMGLAALLMKRYSSRAIITAGIVLTALGLYWQSLMILQIDPTTASLPGIFQGLGMGFFFTPLSAIALATLPFSENTNGSGLFSYGRMLGTSIGISLVSTFVTRHTQQNWHQLITHLQGNNHNLQHWLTLGQNNIHSPLTLYKLSTQVSNQANMISFNQLYYLLAMILCTMIPLVWLLQEPIPKSLEDTGL